MLIFNFKPMGMNSVYSTAKNGRRFMTDEGKDYKAKISAVSFNHFADLKDCDEALRFTLVYKGPWLTNKGKINKIAGDLDGALKLLIDAMCKPLGINDACITEIVARKEYAASWSFEVDLVRTWSIHPAEISKLS